jgi:hypothetical protein
MKNQIDNENKKTPLWIWLIIIIIVLAMPLYFSFAGDVQTEQAAAMSQSTK